MAPPGNRTPRDLLADREWRLRNSAWILLPILSCGTLTFAGFTYIGVKAKRREWWIAGIVYAVLTGVAVALSNEHSAAPTTRSQISSAVMMVVFLGGSVHSILVNRAWLRWRSEHAKPWYAQPPSWIFHGCGRGGPLADGRAF
jgi:hypothetical protein